MGAGTIGTPGNRRRHAAHIPQYRFEKLAGMRALRAAVVLLGLGLPLGIGFGLCAAAQSPTVKPLAVLSTRADQLVTAVRVVIEGRPLWFDLDSGAKHSYVDASTARALRLPVLGPASESGSGKGTVSAVRLGRFRIRLGGVVFWPADPFGIELSHAGSAIDERGLLGYDFYSRYVIEVDRDRRTIAVYDPATYVYRGTGTPIPLVLRKPRAFVWVVVAAAGVRPERHLLRLDTGSSDGVDDDIVSRSSAPKKVINAGVGIGSRFKAYLGTLTEVKVGPFTLYDLPAATGGVQLIGDDVWKNFNIVFDFSRSVMYLKQRLSSASR